MQGEIPEDGEEDGHDSDATVGMLNDHYSALDALTAPERGADALTTILTDQVYDPDLGEEYSPAAPLRSSREEVLRRWRKTKVAIAVSNELRKGRPRCGV